MVEDRIAQRLEAIGFWRRAADRWLNVMQLHRLTDKEREWIRLRRKYCLSCVERGAPMEKLNITEISRAVSLAPGVKSSSDDILTGHRENIKSDILSYVHGIEVASE